MNNTFSDLGLYNYEDFLSTLGLSTNNKSNLYGSYEGFLKGNMFSELYQGYKNYEPYQLPVNSEKEEMLLNLNQLQFAMHDINLYLDVFPDNKDMISKFLKYRNSYNEVLENYEKKYGPLLVSCLNSNGFDWLDSGFPWEGDK